MLSPIYVFWFYFSIAIPYYFVVSADWGFFSERILDSSLNIDIELAVFYSALFSFLAFFSAVLGCFVRVNLVDNFFARAALIPFLVVKDARVLPWFLVLSVGLIVLSNHLLDMGGLAYVWANIGERTALQEGLGYSMFLFEWLITLGTVGSFSVLYAGSVWRKILAVFLISISFLALGATGGRAPQVMLVWVVVFVFHFRFRPLDGQLLVRFLPVIAFIFVIFSVVGLHRASFYEAKEFNAGEVSQELFMTLTQRLSDLDRNVALVTYFDIDNVWGGRSYLNLLNAPVPRTWLDNKPAISDGRYVRTLVDQGEVSANAASDELVGSSWPPRNWIGFMNFHVAGLIFLSFLSGFFVSSIHRVLRRSGSFFFVVLYAAICWGGGVDFSVSGIVRVIMIFSVLVVGFLIYNLVPVIRLSMKRCV